MGFPFMSLTVVAQQAAMPWLRLIWGVAFNSLDSLEECQRFRKSSSLLSGGCVLVSGFEFDGIGTKFLKLG